MRLDFVCAENVQHFETVCFQVIRDKRPMATPPDCFRANDSGRTDLSCNLEQPCDSVLELLRLHVIGVPSERSIAPRSVARVRVGFPFPAKLGEMFVTNSVRAQRFRQRVLVELRITLRAWPGAHVA